MTKPRQDSPLSTEWISQQLDEWLFVENISYSEAVKRLKASGVSTSITAICGWYQRRSQERMLDRIAAARSMADKIRGDLDAAAPGSEDGVLKLITQQAFEIAVSQAPDTGALSKLVNLILRSRRQRLDERRVELLEKRAAQAEAAEGVTKSELSPGEKEAKIREIFGLA